jgi:hypothetical protein
VLEPRFPVRRNLLLRAAILAVAVPTGLSPAAGAASDWATGLALQKRLAAPADVTWSENPLRPALRGLSRAYRVAVLVDRRVDPEQKLDVQVAATPLAEAMQEIARRGGAEVSMLGPVAYFGPPQAAGRLRTLATVRAAEIQRLPPAAARKLREPRAMAWDDFATPRELLEELARQSGIEIAGLDRVPHDLWAAADLPALSLADRVTLVANQFDLTFEAAADGGSVRLVPVPGDLGIVRTYPGGADPEATARGFAGRAPAARIKVVGDKVYVKGMLEDHERLAAPHRLADRKAKPPAAGQVRIERLVVREKPVGPVLEQLAGRLKLELRMDRKAIAEAGISLDQRVSIEVENATPDEVLRALLRTTPLDFRRHGNVVEIGPK